MLADKLVGLRIEPHMRAAGIAGKAVIDGGGHGLCHHILRIKRAISSTR
jgi:hypothetical protein